jgi:tRNA threonylcarbamoyladenosine biosynthesis protein TsaE
MHLTRFLPAESATLSLGAALASALEPGVVVFLRGDLGTGKTTLVRGCLRALGFREKVKSPTYTLVELYDVSSLDLYHFDFYRFDSPQEWAATGFREYFNPASVCMVEWPEKAEGRLPVPDVEIRLGIDEAGRTADIEAKTARGSRCLDRIREALEYPPPPRGG